MSIVNVNLTEDRALCQYVAVYGTLRKGFHNNRLLEGARLIDTGVSEFWGTMFSAGGFPILSCVEPTSKIVVEIWEILDDDMFYHLDCLEGYPGWYDRDIKTFSINGEPIQAWIYHQDELFPQLTEVESGDWKQFVEEHRV